MIDNTTPEGQIKGNGRLLRVQKRGVHGVTDFDIWFSKAYFYKLLQKYPLIRQTPLTLKLCLYPASLLCKVEEASQAELAGQTKGLVLSSIG